MFFKFSKQKRPGHETVGIGVYTAQFLRKIMKLASHPVSRGNKRKTFGLVRKKFTNKYRYMNL